MRYLDLCTFKAAIYCIDSTTCYFTSRTRWFWTSCKLRYQTFYFECFRSKVFNLISCEIGIFIQFIRPSRKLASRKFLPSWNNTVTIRIKTRSFRTKNNVNVNTYWLNCAKPPAWLWFLVISFGFRISDQWGTSWNTL